MPLILFIVDEVECFGTESVTVFGEGLVTVPFGAATELV